MNTKPLSDRLRNQVRPAKQLALEAAAVTQADRQQEAQREAQQQHEALNLQLEQILPGMIYSFDTLTAEKHPALLQATPYDSFVICAVLDRATTDELHLIPGPRLLGTCPRCGSWVPSEQIHTLSQLGALITKFEPANMHNYACRQQTAEPPLSEQLVSLLRQLVLRGDEQ